MVALGLPEHGHHAGHAGRTSTEHGVGEAQRPPVLMEQPVRGRGRRGLAPVIGGDRTGGRVEMHQKGPAAEARGLGLDQTQHGLDRDRGIDCRTAAPQHGHARRDRQRIGRGDERPAGRGRGLDRGDDRCRGRPGTAGRRHGQDGHQGQDDERRTDRAHGQSRKGRRTGSRPRPRVPLRQARKNCPKRLAPRRSSG